MYRNFLPILSLIFSFSFMGLFVKEAQRVCRGLRWVVGSRRQGHGFSFWLRNTRGSGERVERRLATSVTYFIVKWAVGSFLHCALLLLVPDLNGHHWVDVLAHQLAGLDDGYGNLQHKAVQALGAWPSLHTGRSTAGGRGRGWGAAGRKSQSLTW